MLRCPLPQPAVTLSCVRCAPAADNVCDRYVPTQEERNNPLLFARNVRALMADVMKVPVTDHSYHDYLALFDLARPAKIPQTFTLFECRSKYGLSSSQVRRQVGERVHDAGDRLVVVLLLLRASVCGTGS